jgi:hypothetical protein
MEAQASFTIWLVATGVRSCGEVRVSMVTPATITATAAGSPLGLPSCQQRPIQLRSPGTGDAFYSERLQHRVMGSCGLKPEASCAQLTQRFDRSTRL